MNATAPLTNGHSAPAVSLSQKEGALVALYDLGGYTRELGPIVDHMRTRLNITTDAHSVAHLFWPLQRENLVTFLERKGTGGKESRSTSQLSNIRLTERGVARARELKQLDRPARGHVEEAPAAEAQPVMTETKEAVPFVVLSDEEAAQYRGGEITSSGTDVEIAATDSAEAEVMPAEVPASEPQAPVSDTPTEYQANWSLLARVSNSSQFPNIYSLLGKRERIARYRQAAELLADDEAEIALQLLSKVEITPLEEEVLRLIEG